MDHHKQRPWHYDGVCHNVNGGNFPQHEYAFPERKYFQAWLEKLASAWAAVVSLLATTAVCEIPLLAGAFGFTSVEPAEYLVALLLSVLVVPIVELVKWIQRRSAKHED